MMKRYLWLFFILIFMASSSWAAQQLIDPNADYKVRNRITKYNANFTELYGIPSYNISSSDISDWNAKQNRVSGVCGAGYAIRTVSVDGSVTCEATGGGGVSTWLGLTDTPAAYTANYWVKVNSAGTGLELTVAPTGSGDMTGPGSATTDNHIVLFDGTGGTATKQGQCYEDAGKLYCPEFGTTKPDGERYQLITNPGDPTVICDASLDGAWTYNTSTHTRIECKGGTWGPVSSGGTGNVTLTEGATAPTAGSLPEGSLFHDTTDHTVYLQTNTGLLHSGAWGWTANPVTYAMTLGVTGNGTISINSADYTSAGSPYTINGLSGAVTMAAAYGSGEDTLVWSGTGSGNVTGSYPTYQITMDAAKSISADFSTAIACSTPQDGNVVSEGFIGTGYETTGWSETTGTNGIVDEDYTLTGTWPDNSCTEGLRIANTSGDGAPVYAQRDFSIIAAGTVVDLSFTMKIDTAVIPNQYGSFYLAKINDSTPASSGIFSAYLSNRDADNSTVVSISCHGTNSSAYVTISTGVVHSIKFHLDAANSYMDIDGTQYAFTVDDTLTMSHLYAGAVDLLDANESMDITLGGVWLNTL